MTAFLILVSLSLDSFAQSRSAGDHSRGVSFLVPPGWQYKRGDGGYVVSSEGRNALVLVLFHRLGSLDEMRASAAAGVALDNIALSLEDDPGQFGMSGIAASYSGTMGGEAVGAYAVGLLAPGGGGATILAIAGTDEFTDEFRTLARSIAGGLHFTSLPEPKQLQRYRNSLRGAKLTYLSGYTSGTAGSYTAQRVISLCSDGRYRLRGESSVSVYVPGATGSNASTENSEGRWVVRWVLGEVLLELHPTEGVPLRYALSEVQNRINLDETAYMLTRDADCN